MVYTRYSVSLTTEAGRAGIVIEINLNLSHAKKINGPNLTLIEYDHENNIFENVSWLVSH